ncbi:MAG: beta-ketoacyl-[acyl-carrier-protein] synthase II, partial [Methylococcales bacterium]|nr:beta-ketoacyl-[acyl-carrier-protein] synthase II [Methylococcales bacterium]
MHPIPITACSTISACGLGTAALHKGVISGKHCLHPPRLIDIDFPAFVGEVQDKLPEINPDLARFASRNARIALAALNHEPDGLRAALQKASNQYGSHRIGVVIGTSTSGIFETENAYQYLAEAGQIPDSYSFPHQHAWVATAQFLKHELALEGPCYAISTACSSSSKTIACAQRLIVSGVCDAVLAGGVDSLCRLTLLGFKSLDLVAEQPCTPLDQNRSGISLGEGAGLLLLEKPAPEFSDCVHLLGAGESSDAHHMTAPHP